ncbi:MAG TPA: methionine--tRNA ligase [Thermoanaerobaculia bacterium]|nr:methionine--tRNA ligase [Thermoanaerobaculia bacterium]
MAKTFYVTTPIYYVNDLPHIGHLYSTIVADTIARFRRARGEDVRFHTGTDEHGQKIERAAAAQGIAPRALADRVVARYHEWWKTLSITHDDFIRTTEARHARGVVALIRRIEAAGDLYTARHEGWYCTACEAYYTEKELLPGNLCPDHGTACAWQSEENVFFRLSKYQEPLLAHYRAHSDFVVPPSRFHEVESFVEAGLRDLSVSRTNLTWGIPFPGHPGHVVYVWLDALANYITSLGFGGEDDALYRRYWDHPEAERTHLVGKDILRFHAVYWPAFLLSAGLPLPTRVAAHGWWLRDEKKMSKSTGNVVRPDALVAEFGPDALRYFLLREMVFGADASFSDEAFLERYNADLANGLGNAVSRVVRLCVNAYGGTPPLTCDDNEVKTAAGPAAEAYLDAFERLEFSRGLEAVAGMLKQVDGYVAARQPWKVAREEGKSDRLSRMLYASAEGTRIAAAALAPVLPNAAPKALAALGADPGDGPGALAWGGLPAGRPLSAAEPLFPRVDPKRFFPSEVPMSEASAPPGGPKITIEEFQKIELRTAKIVAAEPVPKSKKLMRLEVDLGTERRQVVAGIATRYAAENLVGKTVVIVANLQPAKLMGLESNGMVLAASLPDSGEPVVLVPEAEVPPGTKVK